MKVQLNTAQPLFQKELPGLKPTDSLTTPRSEAFLQAMEKLSKDFENQKLDIKGKTAELPKGVKQMFELQERAQQLHLRTEIVAKGAESVAGALRRLQQLS